MNDVDAVNAGGKVKAKSVQDPELAVIRGLQRVLGKLTDPKAKERVLLYVKSRVENELAVLAVTGS